MSKRAIIISAGYGGLALANLLARAGYTVDVFEKNNTLGGRISVTKQDGFTFDLGPSWYLMPEVFDQYYRIFGESASKRLDIIRFTPGYKVFFASSPPITIQGDIEKDTETFEAIEPGAGDALRRYIQKSSRIYQIANEQFLYTNFTKPSDILNLKTARRGAELVRLISQPLDRYVSRFFTDQRLKQIMEYQMVFLGSSPFEAPALYSLMSHLDFKSGVFYPRRGMPSLVEDMVQLGSSYDITYHTGADVTSIDVSNGRARGITLRDGSSHTADIVVSGADLHFTETQLLAPEHQSFPVAYWKKRQPGPSALLLSLGVRGALPQLEHHNLYFATDWKENFASIYQNMTIPDDASMYICNPSKTDRSLAPPDTENLFILLPLPAGVAFSKKQLESLRETTITVLATIIDQPDLKERICSSLVFRPEDFSGRYNAWAHNAFGGESHLLKQSALFRTPNKSRKVKGLYYVGAGTRPGVGLPMCLMSAQLTYKRIMKLSGSDPITTIEAAR